MRSGAFRGKQQPGLVYGPRAVFTFSEVKSMKFHVSVFEEFKKNIVNVNIFILEMSS